MEKTPGIGGTDEVQKNGSCFKKKTTNWHEMAAAQGHARAQYNIGWYYLFGEGGVPRDQAKASEWLAKAAEQGHASAKYVLAHNYLRGRGVGQDQVRAFELFKEAADQGLEDAKHDLGFCYVVGRGVEKSQSSFFRAFKLFRELALAGYSDEFPEDMYNLSLIHISEPTRPY